MPNIILPASFQMMTREQKEKRDHEVNVRYWNGTHTAQKKKKDSEYKKNSWAYLIPVNALLPLYQAKSSKMKNQGLWRRKIKKPAGLTKFI
jgi:hypothetical protein